MVKNWHERVLESPTDYDVAHDLFNMHKQFCFHDVKLNKEHLKGRLDFIQEELNEAYKALDENNAPDLVDALIDIDVVSIGTLDLSRVNYLKAWELVRRANCSKQPGKNNKRHSMQGMDLTKPVDWIPPDHSDNVGILVSIMQRDEEYKKNQVETMANNLENTLADMKASRRRALEFLDECKEIMLKKADDYNYRWSPVKTYSYYDEGGLYDLYHMIKVKFLRLKSLVWKLYNGASINHEDMTETLRDNIVFSAMTVEYLEHSMDGQPADCKMFGEFTK